MLTPNGTKKTMKQQLESQSFKTDFSCLLKIAQNMPPKPKDDVVQENVNFDQNANTQGPVDTNQPMGQENGSSDQSMNVQNISSQEAANSSQGISDKSEEDKQQKSNYIQDIEGNMGKLLNKGGTSAEVNEDPDNNSVTYHIKIPQYYTSSDGTVYDNLGVAQAIRNFAKGKRATSIRGPLLPSEREAPKGLFRDLPEWVFTITFGGKKSQSEENSSQSEGIPSEHAKPVGRINSGGAKPVPTSKAASASSGIVRRSYIDKDALIKKMIGENQ